MSGAWGSPAHLGDRDVVPPILRALEEVFGVEGRFEPVWIVTPDPDGAPVVYGGYVVDTYGSWWAPLALVEGRPRWTGPWSPCDHDGTPADRIAEALDPDQLVTLDPPPFPDLDGLVP